MLIVNDWNFFLNVAFFAQRVGKAENFKEKINYLHTYSGDYKKTRCRLFNEKPDSFYFILDFAAKENPIASIDDDWKFFMNGGLVYHGPRDGSLAGPDDGWNCHT